MPYDYLQIRSGLSKKWVLGIRTPVYEHMYPFIHYVKHFTQKVHFFSSKSQLGMDIFAS